MFALRRSLIILAAISCCPVSAFAAGDWAPLINRVPESANALVLIDAQTILASPIAVKENWATKQQEKYAQGTSTLPPGTVMAVFAASLEPTTMHNRWEVGLIFSKNDITMPMLAKLEGGTQDTVADESVVLSPKRNVYFAQVAPKTIGAYYPANRQELGRWLRQCKKGSSPGLSNYLRTAAANAAPVTVALDMSDMIDDKNIATYLAKAASLKGKNVSQENLKQLLVGLRGLTLRLSFDSGIRGQLSVDFSASPQAFTDVLKPLLLETLGNFGCMFDGLSNAESKVNGNSFVLSAPFTPEDARRVLMLVHPPTPSAVGEETANPQSPSANPVLLASRRYFSEIDRCIQELAYKRKTIDVEKNWNLWHDKYAEEIERMPVLNVDPELVEFGTTISDRLRTIAFSVRGGNIKMRAVDYQKRSYGDIYGTNYSNYSDVEQQKAEMRAKGQIDRMEIWKSIEEDEAAMRKKMSLKYMYNF